MLLWTEKTEQVSFRRIVPCKNNLKEQLIWIIQISMSAFLSALNWAFVVVVFKNLVQKVEQKNEILSLGKGGGRNIPHLELTELCFLQPIWLKIQQQNSPAKRCTFFFLFLNKTLSFWWKCQLVHGQPSAGWPPICFSSWQKEEKFSLVMWMDRALWRGGVETGTWQKRCHDYRMKAQTGGDVGPPQSNRHLQSWKHKREGTQVERSPTIPQRVLDRWAIWTSELTAWHAPKAANMENIS